MVGHHFRMEESRWPKIYQWTPHGRRSGRSQESWKNQKTDFMRSRNTEEDIHLWKSIDGNCHHSHVLDLILCHNCEIPGNRTHDLMVSSQTGRALSEWGSQNKILNYSGFFSLQHSASSGYELRSLSPDIVVTYKYVE